MSHSQRPCVDPCTTLSRIRTISDCQQLSTQIGSAKVRILFMISTCHPKPLTLECRTTSCFSTPLIRSPHKEIRSLLKACKQAIKRTDMEALHAIRSSQLLTESRRPKTTDSSIHNRKLSKEVSKLLSSFTRTNSQISTPRNKS